MFKGSVKGISVCLLAMLFGMNFNCFCQSNSHEDKPKESKRFSVSVFLGTLANFPTNNSSLSYEMVAPSNRRPVSSKRYSRSKIVSNIEATYWIGRRHGLAFNYSRFNSVYVSGYLSNASGNQTLVQMDARARAYTLFYVYNVPKTRLNVFVGPSFNRVKFKNQIQGFARATSSSLQLGMAGGLSYKIVNQKRFFVDIRATYFWEPGFKQNVVLQENKSLGPGNTQIEFTDLRELKIHPSGLNWGCSVGFKL